MAGKLVTLNPNNIKPLHGVRIKSLYAALLKQMKTDGWNGRPLLVVEHEGGYQAWTGSHRIAAAREAHLNVPCYVLPEEPLQAIGKDAVNGHILNWERNALLHQAFPDDAEALNLMAADANEN